MEREKHVNQLKGECQKEEQEENNLIPDNLILALDDRMKTQDLPLLFIGIGIVCVAYMMKKSSFEGFQAAPSPSMPPMPMPPMPPGSTPGSMPPMPPGEMPPGMPPMPQAMPPGEMPPGAMPPMPPGAMPPMPPTMKPNQQQLMDVAIQVQKISAEQGAVAAQLQQMVQSFGKEGFQSYKNPYNAASPGDTQALEFRLGKKSLIDNVVRY